LLKIKDKINSPTFVISKNYKIKNKDFSWKNLIHIDAYRLEREEDLELIGLKEQLKNPENLIFLESPEMIEKWLPKKYRVDIKLKYIDENTREIIF
jgi:tRNA threonylcarbamoyl adenosine modification protein YjeE